MADEKKDDNRTDLGCIASAPARAPQYQTNCGDFAVNGMWGSNNDYVLSMLVRCADGARIPTSIRCGPALFAEVLMAHDLHRRPGDPPVDANNIIFMGAKVDCDTEIPPGEMWFSFGALFGGKVMGVLSGFQIPLNL